MTSQNFFSAVPTSCHSRVMQRSPTARAGAFTPDLTSICTGSASMSNKPSKFKFGTSLDDQLTGTDRNEFLFGFGGDDVLNGTGGNDHLFGGSGNDILRGGAKNDKLAGNSGNDALVGDA